MKILVYLMCGNLYFVSSPLGLLFPVYFRLDGLEWCRNIDWLLLVDLWVSWSHTVFGSGKSVTLDCNLFGLLQSNARQQATFASRRRHQQE
jgi:hypothetical protein